ncbi:MAG: YggU family protein [Actinobacteria bacterium]|nr:YggU family protein [Actinomycetota bacterium]
MYIKIKVIPGANKNRIETAGEEELRVYVKVPPVKGKANEEMIGLLAKHFKVGKSEVEIVKGRRSRNKVIRINGI